MLKKCCRQIFFYLFSCIEIIILVLLLLAADHFSLFAMELHTALRAYHVMVVGIIILEGFYFFRALKKKVGFLGLPFQMISAFKCDILENIFMHPATVTYGLLFVCGVILLLRAGGIFYLYKNENAARGIPWGVMITATAIDCATFISKYFI